MFSWLWGVILGALGAAVLWLRGSYYRNRAREAEAKAEAASKTIEVWEERQKREEKVSQMSEQELLDYWRK